MLLDGIEVQKGDRIYHISAGYGTVETIAHGTARVRMESGGVLNMGENGVNGLRKQFYWYEPVMFVPQKGKRKLQQKAIHIAQTVISLLEDK